MSERIQIAIVDDHPLFREGVIRTLQAEPDFEIVGQGTTAADAIRLVSELLPDVILLDIAIPGPIPGTLRTTAGSDNPAPLSGGGLEAARMIAARLPVTKIIMLTASAAEEDVMTALKAGARGYILKGVSGSELCKIVRDVNAGEAYVTPALAASLLSEMRGGLPGQRPSAHPLDELTEREREILEGVAAGLSNKEIAQQLFLSEKTIKHYMTNILQKLQVRNRVEAALLAQSASYKSKSASQ